MNKQSPLRDDTKIRRAVKDFEKTNGKTIKNFSIKEIVISNHDEIIQRCTSIEKSLEERKNYVNRYIHDHDVIIQKITDQLEHITHELPEKGFCEKINKTLYTDDGIDKVEYLWHDRRWTRNLLYVILTVFSALSGANLYFNILG